MKILLFSHLAQINEYSAYIEAFRQISAVQSRLLIMGQKEYRLGLETGTFDVVKDILPEQSEIDAADPERSADSLRELENRIGYCFVNRDILMDRYFRGQLRSDLDLNKVPQIWTGARARQFMFLIYRRFEQELASFNPDFVFVETSSAPTRMAWRLAREKGVPAGEFMAVRFWPERLYLETGIGYDWQQARIAYSEMADRPMEGAELATVKQRLQTIRQERTKPAYLQTEHARGLPNFVKKLNLRQRLEGLELWLGKRARTSTRNPRVLPGSLFSPYAQYVRYRTGQKAKRYLQQHQTPFREICPGKYVVYFLHVQPELTVEEMAFDYQDQVNTLRNVLASLPADMHLVVKEHSPMLGYRPVEIYNKLVHMPGVILADTHEDSHKLIAEACLVVTLTGTVALEAVMYGIPAIVLGSIYFDGFNGIYKPESLDALKELLSDPEKLTGATDADALRALGSLLRASKPGKPARIDVRLQGVDAESAKVMLSELEKLTEDVKRER